MNSAADILRFLTHEAARCRDLATRCRFRSEDDLRYALDKLESFTLLMPALLAEQGLEPMDEVEAAAFLTAFRNDLSKTYGKTPPAKTQRQSLICNSHH